MSDTLFRFTEIEYGNSPADEKIVGVFRFEQNQPGKPGPQHVVVAEVFSTLYAYERLLDMVSNAVEQSRTLTAGLTLDPFARFEKLIQRLNEAIFAFHEKEPTPINWNRVNIFLIECSQDQLCLSGHGRLMNLFLQKQPDGSYQAFDLCGSLDQPSEPDPKKLFSSVICGDMKAGDLFFIGSANFERMREDLKLKTKLTTMPPVSAAMDIKQTLEQSRAPDDYAAVLISCHDAHNRPNAAPANFPQPKNQAQESMRQLHENEVKTNQSLAPLINPVKSSKPPAVPESAPQNFLAKLNLPDLWRNLKRYIPRRRPKPTPATATAMRSLDAGHGTMFTTQRKIMIGAVVIVIIGLILGYSTYRHNQKLAADKAAWEGKFSQATDLRNQAESSLMYAKDSQTRDQIQQSESILAGLTSTSDDEKQRIDKLKSELDQIKEKLRKASVVSNATELYSLPITVPDGSLSSPILTSDAAYVADNSNHQIVKIGLSDHASTNIALPSQSGRIIASAPGTKSLIFLDDQGRFYALSLDDNKIQALNKFSAGTSTGALADMTIYNNKAYVLDGSQGQIYRLSKTASGFGNASSYVTADTGALQGAVSLAIDSNVFVAKADGTVLKLLSGKQEAFSLSQIDPPLRSLSHIWTVMDDQRLIATDPADKRLIIFDKNGLLVAQLTSQDFSTLRSVTSALGQKQALVISGNRLLSVPLP